VEVASARPLAAVNGIRAMFDIAPDDSTEPVTLRVCLRSGEQALSETWLCEWNPPPMAERRLGALAPDDALQLG
jgi:glucans biosynthesis protein